MRIAATALIAILLIACQPGDPGSDAKGLGEVPAAASTGPDQAGESAALPAAVDPPASAPVTHPGLIVSTLDGSQYDLSARRGKWVLVNYWATWCNPCLKEMPELSALAAMREDIEVVGLAFEDIEAAEMKAFLAKHPVTYPIAIIDTFNPPADFDEPPGLPMTYLIAPDGRVERKILGPVTAADIEQIIAVAADAAGEDRSEAESAS